MTARIIPFPLHRFCQPAMEVRNTAARLHLVPPKGEAPSLRTTRLADLGSIRIVGTARTLSAQLAEIAERAAGICPNVREVW